MPDRTDAQRAEERALEALGEPWRTDYQDWKKHASITTVPGTLRKYQQAVLGEFLPWVLQQPDIKQASDLTPRHFVRFTDYLRVTPNKKNGENRSSATVRSYQVPTSLFLDWLAGNTKKMDPFGKLPMVPVLKPKPKDIDILTDVEYAALVAAAERIGTKRDVVFLHALDGTGCRCDEMVTITARGMYFREGHYITVIGKTVKYTGPRPVPVTPELYKELRSLLPPDATPDTPVFSTKTRSKKTKKYEALSASGLAQMIDKLCLATADPTGKIDQHGDPLPMRRVGPQRFRRRYASRMSRHPKMDKDTLAAIMGTSAKVLDDFYIRRDARDKAVHEAAMEALGG